VSKTSGHKQARLVGQTSKGGHPVGISPHPESCQTVPVWMGLKKFPKISGAQSNVFVLQHAMALPQEETAAKMTTQLARARRLPLKIHHLSLQSQDKLLLAVWS